MNSTRPVTDERLLTGLNHHTEQAPATVTIAYIGDSEPARRYQHAAADLNIEMVVVTPTPHCPGRSAGNSGADTFDGLIARSALITVGRGCDELTYASVLKAGPKLRPNAPTIRLAHDPLAARYLLQDCGYDIAHFEEIDSGDTWAVTRFARQHGWPVRLSTARWGTVRPDVHLVRPYSELDGLWGDSGQLWLLEACHPLASQLTVAIARRPSGHQTADAVSATTQPDFQPHRLVPTAKSITERAIRTATSIVDGLNTTGISTVKFLHCRDGRLLVDDFNYGLEAELVDGVPIDDSLYAAHLRAVLDLPPEGPVLFR